MEQLLTVADVVARTRLSRTVVYELIASRELPSVAIGRSRRVREADLDAWIQDMLAKGRRPRKAA